MTSKPTDLDILLEEEYQVHAKDIKDMEKWNEYTQQCRHPLLNEGRMHLTSDPNCIVDLISFSYKFNERIKHLPLQEQTQLKALHLAARSALGTRVQLKRVALGTSIKNRYVIEGDVLSPKRAEIIEFFGRYYSVQEVHKIITTDWGYDCSIEVLKFFRERNIDKIKELQEAFKRDYSDIRLGHKRSRLDELSYLYNDRKQRYNFSQGREDYKLLLQTIEQIRKEVEGDTLRIDGKIDINIQATLNFHIFQDMLADLSIIDIIISKICAKNNYNPQYLMTKLRSSMYARLTGFQKEEESGRPQEDIVYPSQLIYDFNRIERMHQGVNVENERSKQRLTAIDAEIVDEITLGKAKNTREEILARLKLKKQNVAVSSHEVSEQDEKKQKEVIRQAGLRQKQKMSEKGTKIAKIRQDNINKAAKRKKK